jgi:DNA-3-methyladenine glycosylase
MTEPMTDPLTQDALAAAPVLTRGFYQRPTVDVARDLIGKLLVSSSPDGIVCLRIDEVEAYLGVDDPACHTFGGRRTPRTETMWGEAGHAYVYFVYGMHHCLNVVTVGEGVPEAVLIRGGRTLAGGEIVRRRRGAQVRERSLTDGPAKICQALAVAGRADGTDLCALDSSLCIRDDGGGGCDGAVERLPRVGIAYAGTAATWPLRWRLSSRPP